MAQEPSRRITHLLSVAEKLNMQGQRRDAIDLCDAAMVLAHAENIDCTRITHQRNLMLGHNGRMNPNVRDLR
jgi:hypothetical protein